MIPRKLPGHHAASTEAQFRIFFAKLQRVLGSGARYFQRAGEGAGNPAPTGAPQPLVRAGPFQPQARPQAPDGIVEHDHEGGEIAQLQAHNAFMDVRKDHEELHQGGAQAEEEASGRKRPPAQGDQEEETPEAAPDQFGDRERPG